MFTKLLKELSRDGQKGVGFSPLDVPEKDLSQYVPQSYLDEGKPDLPEVSEPEVVRHFVELSAKNYHVDKNMYPLGSCTMKYNPKINDSIANDFCGFHPLQPEETVQGPLKIIYDLGEMLKEIAGMDEICLQPAAGAQGELTALLTVRKYFEDQGLEKTEVILPDSAHGTNPASVRMAGFDVVEIKSNSEGLVDLDSLREKISDKTAMFMITNPNTLGLFEKRVKEIAEIVHDKKAFLYMDGANLNALLGIARPGDMGFDITHYNLHKTFSTPHGGGGPGCGPIAVVKELGPYLPAPKVVKKEDTYSLDWGDDKSIGRMVNFYGNFGVMVRAYCYIRVLGAEGLRRASQTAVINANYLLRKLEPYFDVLYPSDCMHEFVLSARNLKNKNVKTSYIAKRLLDYDFHAPTVYFPLIVPEALMIEPTETESKETLDRFVDVLKKIVEEDPEILRNAPHNTKIKKLDEGMAARELKIHW